VPVKISEKARQHNKVSTNSGLELYTAMILESDFIHKILIVGAFLFYSTIVILE
jgi:hypothetical protein